MPPARWVSTADLHCEDPRVRGGGAKAPPLTSLLADLTDLRTALFLPAACYLVIAAFGSYARKPALAARWRRIRSRP